MLYAPVLANRVIRSRTSKVKETQKPFHLRSAAGRSKRPISTGTGTGNRRRRWPRQIGQILPTLVSCVSRIIMLAK